MFAAAAMFRFNDMRDGSLGAGPSMWNAKMSNTACGLSTASSRVIPDAFSTARHAGGSPAKPVEECGSDRTW